MRCSEAKCMILISLMFVRLNCRKFYFVFFFFFFYENTTVTMIKYILPNIQWEINIFAKFRCTSLLLEGKVIQLSREREKIATNEMYYCSYIRTAYPAEERAFRSSEHHDMPRRELVTTITRLHTAGEISLLFGLRTFDTRGWRAAAGWLSACVRSQLNASFVFQMLKCERGRVESGVEINWYFPFSEGEGGGII